MKNRIQIALVLFLLSPSLQAQDSTLVLHKYQLGDGIDFGTADGYVNMSLTGYVQAFYEFKKAAGTSEVFSRFRMRRVRLRYLGDAFHGKLSWRLQTDLAQTASGSDDEASGLISDAFVTYSPNNKFSFTFGQRSTATDNRELTMLSNTLQLVDRSKLTSAFSSIREVGLFMDGNFRVGKRSYIRPTLTLTDGDGSATLNKRYGGLKYGGRINYLPFGLFKMQGEFRQADLAREFRPKLSIGVTYSFNNGISDRRGRESGSILYLDKDQQPSLPDYSKIGADFLFKYWGFSLLGEYVKTWARVPKDIVYRVRNDGSTSTDFGGDVDSYVKNRMMLGEGFNIQAGYMFPFLVSLDGRYTHLKPAEYSFLYNNTFNNRNNFYELGLSKYLTRSYAAKVQVSAIYATTGEGALTPKGNTINGHEWTFQTLVQISF